MSEITTITNQLNTVSPCSTGDDYADLSGEIDSLRQQVRQLAADLYSYNTKLLLLEKLIADGLKNLGDAIAAVASSIDRKIEAVERSLLAAIAALKDFLLGLFSSKTSDLEARIVDLERRLGNFGVQLQDLQALVNSVRSTISELGRRVSSVESQISSLLSSISNLNSSVENLQSQLNTLGTRIDGLQRLIELAISTLRSEMSQLSDRLLAKFDTLQQYTEKLIEQLTAYINSITTRLEQEISLIRNLIDNQKQELTAYIDAQIKRLTDLIYSFLSDSNSSSEYNTLSRRVEILEAAIFSINSKINSIENSISTIQQRARNLASQVANILERLNNLSSSAINMNEITARFDQVLSNLENLSNKVSSTDPSNKLNLILGLATANTALTNSVATTLDVNIDGSLTQSDCKNGSNNITASYSGKSFIGLSKQIESLNQVLSTKLCAMSSTTDSAEQKTANKKVTQIYRILGGDTWFDSADQIKIRHDPEKQLRESGTSHYDGDGKKSKDVESISILSYLNNMLAPQYYRAGYQELPGEVPETLLSIGSDKDRIIKNALDLQQWQIEQLDGLLGQFPIEIEIKDTDPLTAGDQTKKIEIANIAEALAELVGLNFLQSQNSDLTINYLNRIGVETIATKNATLITQDYAKANAAYLGYDANPIGREIVYALNPAGESIDKILADTKGYIIGWTNAEKGSVSDYLKRIFYTVGIIKESNFVRPKNLGRLVDSLNMVKTQETEESSAKLTSDIATMNDQNSTFNLVRKQDTSIPESQVKVKKKT